MRRGYFTPPIRKACGDSVVPVPSSFSEQLKKNAPACEPLASSRCATVTPLTLEKQTQMTYRKSGSPTSVNCLSLWGDDRIPARFRPIFPYVLNKMQKEVAGTVLSSSVNVVLAAPTGAGKTAVLELAIARLYGGEGEKSKSKVIYMAPTKALCAERQHDWSVKFDPIGLKVCTWTGDTEVTELNVIKKANIILTTPEKWYAMTMKWKEAVSVVKSIKLILVDEVHLLSDLNRGAVLEAVVSRMKTVQVQCGTELRFITISATIPNLDDLRQWLGKETIQFRFGKEYRPVPLKMIVEGFSAKTNGFMFEKSLDDQLPYTLARHNPENKPALIFCSTRKATVISANKIATSLGNGLKLITSVDQHQALNQYSKRLKDPQLQHVVKIGCGFHHAGMETFDRQLIEKMFLEGALLCVCCTATLAVGVNFPAHLVVIKSTLQYSKRGGYEEYQPSMVLQMIGRAGRPQFDTSGTAVIMTTESNVSLYQNLANGMAPIESSLHKSMIEHLNSEIYLQTITNQESALEWLRTTFYWIRVERNPAYYGFSDKFDINRAADKLREVCIQNIERLIDIGTVQWVPVPGTDPKSLAATATGTVMARYSMGFQTLETITTTLSGTSAATPGDIIFMVAKSKELDDITLRNDEKKILGALNGKGKKKADAASFVRYPVNVSGTGVVKTPAEKCSVLMQAILGCLTIEKSSLSMEAQNMFFPGRRVTNFLTELIRQDCISVDSITFLSILKVQQAFVSKLWWDSPHVGRQAAGIGDISSSKLVGAGFRSVAALREATAQMLGIAIGKPNGDHGQKFKDEISQWPEVRLHATQQMPIMEEIASFNITLTLVNFMNCKDPKMWHLLAMDSDGKILYHIQIPGKDFLSDGTTDALQKQFIVHGQIKSVIIYAISSNFAGLDSDVKLTPKYLGNSKFATSKDELTEISHCTDEETSSTANYPPKVPERKKMATKRKKKAATGKPILGGVKKGKIRDGQIQNYLKKVDTSSNLDKEVSSQLFMESAPLCDGCGEDEAVSLCHEAGCEQVLCKDCTLSHRKLKITRNHQVTAFNWNTPAEFGNRLQQKYGYTKRSPAVQFRQPRHGAYDHTKSDADCDFNDGDPLFSDSEAINKDNDDTLDDASFATLINDSIVDVPSDLHCHEDSLCQKSLSITNKIKRTNNMQGDPKIMNGGRLAGRNSKSLQSTKKQGPLVVDVHQHKEGSRRNAAGNFTMHRYNSTPQTSVRPTKSSFGNKETIDPETLDGHSNFLVANVANKDIHSKLLDDYEAKYNLSLGDQSMSTEISDTSSLYSPYPSLNLESHYGNEKLNEIHSDSPEQLVPLRNSRQKEAFSRHYRTDGYDTGTGALVNFSTGFSETPTLIETPPYTVSCFDDIYSDEE